MADDKNPRKSSGSTGTRGKRKHVHRHIHHQRGSQEAGKVSKDEGGLPDETKDEAKAKVNVDDNDKKEPPLDKPHVHKHKHKHHEHSPKTSKDLEPSPTATPAGKPARPDPPIQMLLLSKGDRAITVGKQTPRNTKGSGGSPRLLGKDDQRKEKPNLPQSPPMNTPAKLSSDDPAGRAPAPFSNDLEAGKDKKKSLENEVDTGQKTQPRHEDEDTPDPFAHPGSYCALTYEVLPHKKGHKKKHKRIHRITGEQRINNTSEETFHKLKQKRKPRLEKLLQMIDSLEKPSEEKKVLENLVEYGIPEQKALLDFNLMGDSHRHEFGHFIKLMYSPALRTILPFNCANVYLPIAESSPSVEAVRYKGVRMKADEFAQVEALKAEKRHKLLDQVEPVSVNEEHFKFLRDLAVQQMSSLPLTLMHDILYEQIQVVEKYCESYSKKLGSTNQSTTVAVSHYNLMKKHLEAFQFMGLRPMPTLCLTGNIEHPPQQENQFVTSSSSSSSEGLDELETFLKRGEGNKTMEEMEATEIQRQDELILQMDPDKKTAANIGLPDVFIGDKLINTVSRAKNFETLDKEIKGKKGVSPRNLTKKS